MTPLLNRVSRQRWSYSTKPECRGRTGGISGNDCDEYPFASTREGGPVNYAAGKVSLRPVFSGHNQAAGRKLGGFYSHCRVKKGDPIKGVFGVAVNMSSPKTVMICPKE
nr:NucA/NucB deoxyribonuclease domain-containing protein [Alteromonas sp. PRIM-21]